MKNSNKNQSIETSSIPTEDFKITREVLKKFKNRGIHDTLTSEKLFTELFQSDITLKEFLTALHTSITHPQFKLNGYPFIFFLFRILSHGMTGFINWYNSKILMSVESERLVFNNLLKKIVRTKLNNILLLSAAHKLKVEPKVLNFLITNGHYSIIEVQEICNSSLSRDNFTSQNDSKGVKRKKSPTTVVKQPKKVKKKKVSELNSFTDLKPAIFDYSEEEKSIKVILDLQIKQELDKKAKNTLKVLSQCEKAGVIGRLKTPALREALNKTTFSLKDFLMACKLSTLSNLLKYKKAPFTRLLFTFILNGNVQAFTKWFKSKLTTEMEDPVFRLLLKDVLRTSGKKFSLIQFSFVKSASAMQLFIIKYGDYSREEIYKVTSGLKNKRGNKITRELLRDVYKLSCKDDQKDDGFSKARKSAFRPTFPLTAEVKTVNSLPLSAEKTGRQFYPGEVKHEHVSAGSTTVVIPVPRKPVPKTENSVWPPNYNAVLSNSAINGLTLIGCDKIKKSPLLAHNPNSVFSTPKRASAPKPCEPKSAEPTRDKF